MVSACWTAKDLFRSNVADRRPFYQYGSLELEGPLSPNLPFLTRSFEVKGSGLSYFGIPATELRVKLTYINS